MLTKLKCMTLTCLRHASCNKINKASVTPPPSYDSLRVFITLDFYIFQGHQNCDITSITLNLMFSTVTIIRKSVSLVMSKGPNMAMQVKAKEIVLQQCRLMKQNARKSFTFKNMYLNKHERDFVLQVRYLYFEINFNFICTAKLLTFLNESRIYFICTAKFLTFSDDGGI